MRDVCIAGCGFTQHASKRSDVNIAELIHEAVDDVFKQTGLSYNDVDAITIGNMPSFEGLNYPELWASDHIYARHKPVLRITTGGTTGGSVCIGSYYQVASGMFDTVLGIAFEHQSNGSTTGGLATVGIAEISLLALYGMSFDSLRMIMSAGGAAGAASFQAIDYMKRSGATQEDLARVVVNDRRNAAKNWYTHLKMPNLTVEEVMKTPMVAYPLRFGMICPASDGACAMIYTTPEKAKKIVDRPAYVNGVSSVSDEPWMFGIGGGGFANLDPCEQKCCKLSAKNAYKMAGVDFPQKEIDYAEIYAPFPNQALMFSERIGLFNENTAPQAWRDGRTKIDGDMPINASGGVNATNAIGASAMERVAEAALQIMGKAGDHQVKHEVHDAVAHGWGGSVNLITMNVLGDQPRRK